MHIGVERGQYDHFWRAVARPEQFGRGEAVHPGHADVHQDDVRGVPPNVVGHLGSVRCLAHDTDPLSSVEHHAQTRAQQRIIVNDDHGHLC